MGGKTETYTDLQAQQVFSSADNLYAKELVRLFAIYKKVIPSQFTMSMIELSRKYFSPEVFEALGVGVKSEGFVWSITDASVNAYIDGTFGYPSHVLYYYSTKDKNGTDVNPKAMKIKESLDDLYTFSTSASKSFVYDYTFDIGDFPSYGDCIANSRDVYQAIHGNLDPVNETISVSVPAYEVVSGEWYVIKDDEITDSKVTMILLDANWVETGTEIEVTVVEDFRSMYLYRFAYADATCTTWDDVEADIFYKDELIAELNKYVFFIFPIKDNGDFVETEKYQDVLLSDFGFSDGTLEDSLGDSRIEKAMLTYSTEFDNPDFKPWLNLIYGEPGNRNETTFNTPHYNIRYYPRTEYGDGTLPPVQIGLSIDFDGYTFTAEGRNVALLPVDIFQKMTMPQRYEYLNEMFRIWGGVSEEVKLKWYQTGLFKLVAFIVVAAIAIVSQQYYLIFVYAGFKIGYQILKDVLPPEVLVAISVVIAIVTFDVSTALSTFASISNIANQMSQFYFISERKQLTKEMESVQEEHEEARKHIEDMQKDTLYIPFDSYTSYYDGMYSIAEESYTTTYEAMYDFDKMLKPKLGVRNG